MTTKSGIGVGGFVATTMALAAGLYFMNMTGKSKAPSDEAPVVAISSWEPSPAYPGVVVAVWVNRVRKFEKSGLRDSPHKYTFTAQRGASVEMTVSLPVGGKVECHLMRGEKTLSRRTIYHRGSVSCAGVV